LYGNEGNGNGLVANATTPYHNGHKVFRFDTRYKGTTANFNKTYGDSFYYGYITAKTSRSVTLNILDYASDVTITSSNYDEFGKYTISADANQYTITGTKKATAKVEIGAYDFGNIDKRGTGVDGTANNTDDEVYTVLVRTYEDKVVDIIGLDTTVAITVAELDDTLVTVASAPVVTPVAPVAPVVEEKAEVKEEIVELEGFDL